MMWRALTRSVALRLLLLMAITSAGPAGAASSWHLLDAGGHHLTSGTVEQRATLAAASHAATAGDPCAACQFGSALRVFAPAPAVAISAPMVQDTAPTATSTPAVAGAVRIGHAGRAPPSAS